MGIRKQKPGPGPAGPNPGRPRARRDYVEEVQRRAGKLKERLEKDTKKGGADDVAVQHQRRVQQHMAQLRSEAVQARRLAEQIDSLSQQTTAGKRKRTMTNTPAIEPGHSPGLQRRSSDKPAGAGSQSNFNPLHPSMELPPEQLIRLLGLEDKKGRKKRKHSAAVQTRPAMVADRGGKIDEPRATVTTKRHAPVAPPAVSGSSRSMQRRQKEQTRAASLEETRRKLLLPAIGAGLVAGIAVSVFLFGGQRETHETGSAVSSKPVPAARPAPVIRNPQPSVQADKPVVPRKVETTTPAPVNNPKWQAAIRAQEQRLREAARERLDGRIRQANQSASVTAPDVITANPPVSAPTAAAPAEPLPPAPSESDYPLQYGETASAGAPEAPAPDELAPPQPAPEPTAGDLPPGESPADGGISDGGMPPAPAEDSLTAEDLPVTEPAALATEPGGNAETPASLPGNDAPTVEPAVTEPSMNDVTAVESPVETAPAGIPMEPYSVEESAPAAGSAVPSGD